MDSIRDRYRRFAEAEARGVSALYEELALGVARDETLCAFLSDLPPDRQQPNLLFGAVRRLCGTPRSVAELGQHVQVRGDEIAAFMRSHTTQTNEPGRCAALLPALAGLPQPLALLEVGASAGLCLFPDRYGYDYGGARLSPADRAAYPVFACTPNRSTPIPERLPQVVWRAGIDLNPLRTDDGDAMDWLRALVWPEHVQRAANLELAIGIARRDPPRILEGDLIDLLPGVASSAPEDATLVVFHTAVLCYLEPERRAHFIELVRQLPATWIANEGPGVLPAVAARIGGRQPAQRFLLSVDGRPAAFTGPHGQSVDWIA